MTSRTTSDERDRAKSIEAGTEFDRHLTQRLGVNFNDAEAVHALKENLAWISQHRLVEKKRRENRTKLFWALLAAAGTSAAAKFGDVLMLFLPAAR